MRGRSPFLPFAVIMFLGIAITVWISLKGYVENNRMSSEEKSEEVRLYERGCSGCHGANLEGTPAGPPLKPLTLTSEVIESMTINGVGTMAGGFLVGEDAKKVADWIVKQNQSQ